MNNRKNNHLDTELGAIKIKCRHIQLCNEIHKFGLACLYPKLSAQWMYLTMWLPFAVMKTLI